MASLPLTLKPTVSIYSALTERLLTGRDMVVGDCQGRLLRSKLHYCCFAIGQSPRAGRTREQCAVSVGRQV